MTKFGSRGINLVLVGKNLVLKVGSGLENHLSKLRPQLLKVKKSDTEEVCTLIQTFMKENTFPSFSDKNDK